jgi:hypothetical protein
MVKAGIVGFNETQVLTGEGERVNCPNQFSPRRVRGFNARYHQQKIVVEGSSHGLGHLRQIVDQPLVPSI